MRHVTTMGWAAVVLMLAAGPAAKPPAVGERAPEFALKTVGGAEVTLAGRLAEGQVVLVVLRGWPGYQCPLCAMQVADLVGSAKEIAAAGAKVVLVYPGPAEGLKDHAGEFESGKGLPAGFELVMDPDYVMTNAYGLRWDEAGETAYPATFVIGKDGVVKFSKVAREHGGRVKAAEVVKALK